MPRKRAESVFQKRLGGTKNRPRNQVGGADVTNNLEALYHRRKENCQKSAESEYLHIKSFFCPIDALRRADVARRTKKLRNITLNDYRLAGMEQSVFQMRVQSRNIPINDDFLCRLGKKGYFCADGKGNPQQTPENNRRRIAFGCGNCRSKNGRRSSDIAVAPDFSALLPARRL